MQGDGTKMQPGIDLRILISLVRRWVWLLIVIALACGGGMYALVGQITPIYEAVTTIMVNQVSGANLSEYNSVLTSERLTGTYAKMLTTRPLLSAVTQQLGLPLQFKELQESIEVRAERNTQLVVIAVRDPDPQQAASIANTLVREFADLTQQIQVERFNGLLADIGQQIATLEQQIQRDDRALTALRDKLGELEKHKRDQLEMTLLQNRKSVSTLLQRQDELRLHGTQGVSNIIQVDPAVAPDSPVFPRPALFVTLATIAGLLFAVALVTGIELYRDTVQSADELTHRLGLPILGSIPQYPGRERLPMIVSRPHSPEAEAFRQIRTNLQFASVDRDLHTVLITSPTPSDGKSTISSNLATALALNDQRVVLLEGDLRRPRLHNTMDLPIGTGLTDLFKQTAPELEHVLRRTDVDGVMTILAGALPPNPSELLGSGKMREILQHLRQHADLLIIDAPPMLVVTDAAVLAQQVDGVIIVVRAGHTRMRDCRQTIAQLRYQKAPILGIIYNGVPTQQIAGYGRYNDKQAHLRNKINSITPTRTSGTVHIEPSKDAQV